MRQLLLIIIMVVGLSTNVIGQDNGNLIVRRDSKDTSQFICDVKFATFKTPKGWQPNKSGKNTYAILSPEKETYPNLTKMISIDIFIPANPTAKTTAEAFAKKWNGEVLKSTLKIDGESGYRVTIPPDKKKLKPIDCIVAMKGERVFLIIGGALEDGELSKTLDEIAASWKWK